MAGWKEQWHTLTSFLLCAAVIVLGTLLYPLFLLLFTGIALLHPLYRRFRPSAAPSREGSPQGEAGR